MRKMLNALIVISLLLFIGFYIAFKITGYDIFQPFYITFMTFSYHFVMRLAVGRLPIFQSKFDCNSKWFQIKSFEKKLYKVLKVKKWKSYVPAYYPEAFDTKHNSLQQIVNNMCNAELVHEKIAVLSFVPILFSIKYGMIIVFVVTSVLACLFDLIFVVVQRYNRPRVAKLISKMK